MISLVYESTKFHQSLNIPRSIAGQGPIALAVGAGGGCSDVFSSRLSFLSSISLSLGDAAIYVAEVYNVNRLTCKLL